MHSSRVHVPPEFMLPQSRSPCFPRVHASPEFMQKLMLPQSSCFPRVHASPEFMFPQSSCFPRVYASPEFMLPRSSYVPRVHASPEFVQKFMHPQSSCFPRVVLGLPLWLPVCFCIHHSHDLLCLPMACANEIAVPDATRSSPEAAEMSVELPTGAWEPKANGAGYLC